MLSLLLVVHSALVMPPLGAVYSRTVRLPVIGRQTVQLSIVSRKVARLQLMGRLSLDEPVQYEFSPSGELSFSLTESTLALLRRFRTTLNSAGYEAQTDTSYVDVWPPLPLSIRIRLDRRSDDGISVSQRRWDLDSWWRSRSATIDDEAL